MIRSPFLFSALLAVAVVLLLPSSTTCYGFKNQPSGACCIVDHMEHEPTTKCIEVPLKQCSHIRGDYMDDFTRCIPNPAHPCVGACCTSHGCKEVVESHCYEMNGAWTKAGTRCNNTGNFCPPNVTGACCYKNNPFNPHDFGSCTVETFLDCYSGRYHAPGAFWTDGTHCDIPGICPFLLVPYQEQLPIPKTLQPYKGKSGCQCVFDENKSCTQIKSPQHEQHPEAEYEVQALPVLHTYYTHFPNGQAAFAYEGQVPGPVIEACHGVPISVKYVNKLPDYPHPLGFDSCVHGSDWSENVPFTSVHLHGAHNPTRYDGWPEALVYPGEYYYYYYENLNAPTMLFYHDHGLGITRKNVMMGLSAPYIIRNPQEPELPSGHFEVPLVLADKSFTWKHGKVDLYYPPNFHVSVPFKADDFTGTNAIVNGVVNPYFDVAPAQYRFRILNGANSRTFTIHFVQVTESGSIVDIPFLVIGSDQGFVYQGWVTELCIMASERADVIFDFSQFSDGDRVWLTNSAPTPFPNGTPRSKSYIALDSEYDLPELLEFRVTKKIEGHHPIDIPHDLLKDFHRLSPSSAHMVRSFLLEDMYLNHTCNAHRWFVKRFKVDGHPEFGFLFGTWDAIYYLKEHFMPLKDSIEIWEFWNPGNESHPMHVHGYAFQVLSTKRIEMHHNDTRTMRITHDELPFQPTETAWKDTIEVPPKCVTSIIIKFNLYSGKFPMHCHILEHEDHEMMRQFRVIDSEHPCHIVSAAKCGNGVCESANGENCINCPFDCIGGPHFCCGWGEHSDHIHYIGCGNMIQAHQGQCGVCQHFQHGSNFEYDITCRRDYTDHCCNDHGCDY